MFAPAHAHSTLPITRVIALPRRGASNSARYMPPLGAASLRSNGTLSVATASNALFVNQANASFAFMLQINAATTAPQILVKNGITNAPIIVYIGTGPLSVNIHLHYGTGAQITWSVPIPIGVPTHFAISWTYATQTLYVNGAPFASASVNSNTWNENGALYAGQMNGGATTFDYQIGNLAVWNGYALSRNDAIGLRNQTITPMQTSTPASAYWAFGGSLSAPVGLAGAGVADLSGNGNTFGHLLTGPLPGTPATNDGSLTYGTQLVYSPPVICEPYVSKNGLVFFNMIQNNPGQAPAYVSAVPGTPAIQVNGVSVTANGPFWTMVEQNTAWVAYSLDTVLTPSDVLTYTAADFWATTAAGGVGGAATPTPIPNYLGQIEPPVGASVGFTMPSTQKTMLLGTNVAGPTAGMTAPAGYEGNWLHRTAGWTGAYTTVPGDYKPTSVLGTASAAFVEITATNYVDSTCYPSVTGVWTLVADEQNPSAPMTVSLSQSYEIGSLTISGPTITHGVINSQGVEVGKMWQWNVSYVSNPVAYSQYLQINVTAYNNASPGNWTLKNEYLFAPVTTGAQPTSFTRPVQWSPDPNVINALTTPNGNGPACIRFMDSLWGYGGDCSTVDPTDLPNPEAFSWFYPSTDITVTITEIRPYSLTNSPYLYTQQWGTPTAPGSPGSYAITLPAWTTSEPMYLAFGGQAAGDNICMGEAVTSAAHGLRTGQQLHFGFGSISVPATDGPTNTVNWSAFHNANVTVFVTGANTFAFAYYGNSTHAGSGASMPGQINNVSVPTTVNVTGTVSGTNSQSYPVEFACALVSSFPNTNLWINVPPAATDATVKAIAQKTLAGTQAGRKTYVEYYNEPWNMLKPGIGFFNALGSLGYWGGNPTTDGDNLKLSPAAYALRASQIHAIFTQVYAAAGRSNEIVRVYGCQFTGAQWKSDVVAFANSYNATSPATPIQIDAIAVAPYMNVPMDQRADPTIAATVNPTAGGTTGGLLAAGTYYLKYTWVDSLTKLESSAGSSQSAQFTVAAGDIPVATISLPNATSGVPQWASAVNVYLTPVNGASGSEVQYLTGNPVPPTGSSTTVPLKAANPVTGTAPPAHSAIWSFKLGAASIASTNPNSIVYGASWTPWTRGQLADIFRHYLVYGNYLSSGVTVGGLASNYIPVGSQPANFVPEIVGYEGSIGAIVPTSVGTNDANQTGSLHAILTHDMLYDPSMRDLQNAYYTAIQLSGVALQNEFSFCDPPFGMAPGVWGWQIWGDCAWVGQQWGAGDGSDGKAVNQFALVTNKSEHYPNVSVKLQGWRDWAQAANPLPAPPPQSSPKRRWFPQLSSFYRGAIRPRGR